MNDSADSSEGYVVLSYLISGVGMYGLLGWLGDRYFHTEFLLPVGILLGAVLSLYIIIKRFGDSATTASVEDSSSQGEESE